eukprot:gene8428-9329_t
MELGEHDEHSDNNMVDDSDANSYDEFLITEPVEEHIESGSSDHTSINITIECTARNGHGHEASLTQEENEIDKCSNFENGTHDLAKSGQYHNLKQTIDAATSPFAGIGTNFLRESIFQENGLSKPRSVHLGYRNEDGKMKQDTFQYVPILESIAMILNDENMFKQLFDKPERINSTMLRVFKDATRFKESAFFNGRSDALQVALYYDDLEVLAVSTWIQISTNTSDMKKYGHNKILHVIVDDVKLLEQGVEFHLSSGKKTVFGTLVLFLGDNPAANSLLGFQESFSANKYCRFCSMSSTSAHMATKQQKDMLRTSASHSSDLDKNDSKSTGVRFDSVLNTLKFFHVSESFSPDIMHDILEGACKFDMALLLGDFIKRKIVSLEYLNNAVDSFNYRYPDARNKPSAIEQSHLMVANIRQNATQMWCFMIYLPMWIGHLVPAEDEMWTLFCLFREIMDLCFCPEVSLEQTYYLESLVSEHNELFMKLAPNSHLKPKFHFMTDYGEALRRNGPL